MPVEPNGHLLWVAPAVHGGATDRDRLSGGEALVDFSVNSNPYGPSPAALDAVRYIDITRYPDPDATALREAVATKERVSTGAVLPGNGSLELMFLAAHAYLAAGDKALVFGPTFGEYARAAMVAGAEVVEATASPADGYQFDGHAMDAALGTLAPRVTFICNPNNPTGRYVPAEALRALAARHPHTLFLIDEAYLPFVDRGESCVRPELLANVVVLRSMTKDGAMPGLRLGYALARPGLLDPMRTAQPTWSVNALAQAAGVATLQDTGHWARSIMSIRDAKRYLTGALSELGCVLLPSDANYFLWQVRGARGWRQALLTQGCLVRDCSSFGMRGYLRVSVRTTPECERLVAAIRSIQQQGEGL